MKRKAWLAAFLLLLTACKDKEPRPQAGPAAPPSARAPRDEFRAYEPPKDGRLTPRQVDLFLQVSKKLRASRPGAEGSGAALIGDPVESSGPDLSAARGVFENLEEYLWVKERVLEAEAAFLAGKLRADELALLTRTLESLRSRRDAAPDEASKKLLSEQIAGLEAEGDRTRRETAVREPEAVRANMRAIEPHRAEIAALEAELIRLSPLVPPGPG